jgi:hypothetical protein
MQYYGGSDVDASLLLIPHLGFLPPDDPRVVGTIGVEVEPKGFARGMRPRRLQGAGALAVFGDRSSRARV